jgi:hypothetical protein
MNVLKKSISVFLIFIFLVGIIVIFRSFLMAYIVEPIALLFWAIWRVVSSVNQNTYWIILIALCIIFMIRMLPFEEGKPSKLSYTYSYKPPTRVDYWRNLIKDSVLGKNENEKLRKYLKELLITVISQTEGIPAIEAEKKIEKGTTTLSPFSHQYLFSSNMKDKFFQENTLNTIYFLPRWLRRWGRKLIHQNNSVIDEILDYTETELEINDEK